MTDHTTSIAIATKAYNDADRALRDINEEMRVAIETAKRAIEAEYRERRVAASSALNTARQTLDAAKIAATSNSEMVGKKVSRTESKPVSKWSSRSKEVTIFGIVEVMTPETVISSKITSFSRPKNGDLFVRLLKANGEPGLNIENMMRWKAVD